MMNQTNPHSVELLSETMETLVNRTSIIPARYDFKIIIKYSDKLSYVHSLFVTFNFSLFFSFIYLLFLISSFSLSLPPPPLSLSLSPFFPFLYSFFFPSLPPSLRAVCEVVLSEISTNNLMTWRQGLTLIHNIIGAVDYKVIIEI